MEKEPATPGLLLHVPFQDSVQARLARGDAGGTVDPKGEPPVFRTDEARSGAYFGRNTCVHYGTAGNFNRTEGTVTLWFKPDWSADFDDTSGRVLWDVRIEEGSVVPDDPSQRWALVYPNPIRGKQNPETVHRWRFCVATNRNRLIIGTDKPRPDKRTRQAVWGSPQSFPAGQWMHLAVSWNAESGAIYVNGREDARAPLPEGLPWRRLPETLQVGALESWINAGPCGVIADFRVFGHALSGEEIRLTGQRTQGDPYPQPAAG